MDVEGDIRIGEAGRWTTKAAARLNGYPWPVLVSNLVSGVAAVAVVIGYGALQSRFGLPAWTWLPLLAVGLYLSWRAGVAACRACIIRFARKAFAERGLVDPVGTRYRIEPHAFVTVSGLIETRAPWAAVSDIFPAGPYWIILAQSNPTYLPRRFFADPTAERAFVGAILARMPPDAVARSGKATAFTA